MQQCFPQDLKRLRWLKVVSKVRRTVEKSTPISAETRKSTPISAETRKEHSRLSRDQKKHSHLSRDQKKYSHLSRDQKKHSSLCRDQKRALPSQKRPEEVLNPYSSSGFDFVLLRFKWRGLLYRHTHYASHLKTNNYCFLFRAADIL